MERAVQELSLSTATAPITADPDADPYKMFQVHDYKGVSFLRQAPQVKAASTETIRVFATAYPELLKEKFFINVPAVMGFMYGFMKLFVAARTIVSDEPILSGSHYPFPTLCFVFLFFFSFFFFFFFFALSIPSSSY